MQTQTAWATGFLTQLILRHLHRHYPSPMKKIDPRTFFSGIEGYDSLKNPQSLLMDNHAWLPEEVLREVLLAAERVSGDKEIAHRAVIDYFGRSAEDRAGQAPSIFEIIARTVDDVRTVALCSGLWASAYTTFMKLQAVTGDPDATELIILSQWEEGFRPLIGSHFMLKGNYEGFVRLYDFVETARLDTEFLQYRVRDIVGEFEGYTVEEEDGGLTVMERGKSRPAAVFRSVRLDREEILFRKSPLDLVDAADSFSAASTEKALDGWILRPRPGPDRQAVLEILAPRESASRPHDASAARALKVVRGGSLRSGSLEYVFHEGEFYETPYSRYRFFWKERPRPVPPSVGLEKRIQKMTVLLFDYLQELKATQQRLLAYAVENKALTAENVYLRRVADEEWADQKPLGQSRGMQAVLDLVRQVASTDSTVLITGETGTGKELIARRIHQSGARRDRRFVAINCAAVPEGLLESELFGHERGAFTGAVARKIGKFEWADGGTLFLDEVGEIPPAMQAKLLRVLQERALVRVGGNEPIGLDLRVVAATNQDLRALIEKGLFRKDLYYRLNVIPIQLPPLRERLEDLPALAEHFLGQFRRKLRKNVQSLSPSVLDRMQSYSWPGNIRELENVLERALTLIPAEQTVLTPDLLPPEIRQSAQTVTGGLQEKRKEGRDVKAVMDGIEWQTLMDAMKVEDSMDAFLRKVEWAMAQRAMLEYGSKTEAARVLKRTYRWLRKLEKEMEDKPSA